MKHKVIKPVAHGHFEEVWEEQGPGSGQRHIRRKAPQPAALPTAGRVGYRRQAHARRP